MKLLTPVCTAALLFGAPLAAQSPPGTQELRDVLPADAKMDQFALTTDGQRTYFVNGTGEVWMFDRSKKTSTRVAGGVVWDLNLAPTRDAIAYTKAGDRKSDQYVWVLRLNPETGLAVGAERRLSTHQGDVPAISPDGKSVAFARDDSTGVGQSVVVVPIGGGAERVVAPSLPSSVGNIRWTPDSKRVYFGVNSPVPCVPEWSCLPLAQELRQPPGTIRRVSASGGAVSVVATARGVFPGLSPDGSTVMYIDTGSVRRWVVADTSGRRLDNVVLPSSQAAYGWLSGSTVLIPSSGNARRMRTMSLGDARARVLLESAEQVGDPAWAADGSMFSLIGRAAKAELRILNADGSARKTIALPEPYATASSWSPDQRWVAYTGYQESAPPHIAIVEIATGRTVKLYDASEGAAARWSADSRSVVVSEIVGTAGKDRRAVFRQVDLSGKATALREVALTEPQAAAFAIDASMALVIRKKPNDLTLVRLTSDSERVILPASAGVLSSAWFSADGQWFAVRRMSANAGSAPVNAIELFRSDGTTHTTVELPFVPASGSNLQILPGGKELIVTEARRQDADPAVYLVNVATRATQKLFAYSAQYQWPEVAVSPAARTILYLAWEPLAPALYTMDLSSRRAAGGK